MYLYFHETKSDKIILSLILLVSTNTSYSMSVLKIYEVALWQFDMYQGSTGWWCVCSAGKLLSSPSQGNTQRLLSRKQQQKQQWNIIMQLHRVHSHEQGCRKGNKDST